MKHMNLQKSTIQESGAAQFHQVAVLMVLN
jgi:hypothetical protein